MAAGKINLQANDGSVVGLVVPDGLGSGERQIALGVNLSGITAYHLLQGNLAVSNEVLTNGFSTTLYTGNGATQSVNTGIDMDTQWGNDVSEKFGGLVWLKSRSTAGANNYLFDSIRGASNPISSNGTASNVDYVTSGRTCSLSASGFSIGSEASINSNLSTNVSWNFQTRYRITGTTNHGKAYTCHCDPSTGFTIVKYEGSGLAGHEIPHHLGRKLGFRAIKNLSIVTDWVNEYDDNGYVKFNTTDAYNTSYKNTSSDTAYNINSAVANWNQATNQYIMYGWANSYYDEADKLIGNYEIGVYQGTGVACNKVNTRGKPAWIMLKRLYALDNWVTFDNQRVSGINDGFLYPNLSNAEAITTDFITLLQDGFNINQITSTVNASGGQYLYMVVYDNDSGSGKSKYPRATDSSQLQLNTALVPFANGIDSNGAKNTIVYKNETITGLTYTSGKNYVYAKNDGTYGVNKFKEQYNSYNGFGDYFDTNKNKWFNNISTFSDDCSTTTNFIADEVTGGTASVISSVNGELKVLNSVATYGGARFQFSAINGKKYRVKFKLTSNSTTCTFGIGTAARSLNLGYVSLSSAGDYYLDFVASGTLLYCIAYNNNVSGAISTWDDIAIYPINNDGSMDISNATEITESRNYLDAIVHADQNGQVAYVEELPKIEYKDIVKANEFRGKNACTAWMVANGSVTPPIIYDEEDISSLIRTATGTYRMYFKERMDNINYSIGHMVKVETNPYQSTIYPIAKTLDYFEFATSSSSAYVNASVLDIHIYGGRN